MLWHGDCYMIEYENIGYENSAYFYKKFAAKYGCPPREYRKKHQLSKNAVSKAVYKGVDWLSCLAERTL